MTNQPTYDRNTPGRLLGHTNDDSRRAWAIVTRKPSDEWINCYEQFIGEKHREEAAEFVRKMKGDTTRRAIETSEHTMGRQPGEYVSRVIYQIKKDSVVEVIS